MSTRFNKIARVVVPGLAGAALSLSLAGPWLMAQQPATPAAPATQPAAAAPATQPAATATATRPGPDAVAMKVGDQVVTLGEFEAFLSNLDPSDQEMARGPYRRAWAESLANMKLLAAEARKKELDKTPAVQRQLDAVRDQVLANALVVDFQQNLQQKVGDEELRKHFQENPTQFERIAARHILIRTPDSRVPVRPGQNELTAEEAKAKIDAIAARIKAGEDFAKIAETESDDVSSAIEGGDLGSFSRGRMVEAFEKTAFALKEGQLSEPVQSQFGWHLIQVTGRYDTFEQLVDVLRESFAEQQAEQAAQKTRQYVEDLRSKAKIEMNDTLVGPPLPRMPAPGAAPGAAPGTAPTE